MINTFHRMAMMSIEVFFIEIANFTKSRYKLKLKLCSSGQYKADQEDDFS